MGNFSVVVLHFLSVLLISFRKSVPKSLFVEERFILPLIENYENFCVEGCKQSVYAGFVFK